MYKPVRSLDVFYEPEEGRRVAVGHLSQEKGEIRFEYDPEFLELGLPLSPFHLPLTSGDFVGTPEKFGGIAGLFDDSLPDGWGRRLIHLREAKQGISPALMTPLDRLAMVGTRGVGALVYAPEVEFQPPEAVSLKEIDAEAQAVISARGAPDLERLIALGGPPQGSRPKVLVQRAEDGTIYGDVNARPECKHYLVKFRSTDDDANAAPMEQAYMLMAAAASIEVPESRLLGKHGRHPGYFGIERFDRTGKRKIHSHTLSGLLHAPPGVTFLDYQDLLRATRELTRNEAAVAEMFRRACFNVLAHNRDDHARNFAFLMDERGAWRPSPAYDLTFFEGPGGEHHMTVMGEGAAPGTEHLLALAKAVDLRGAKKILEEVRAAVSEFLRFADEVGLARKPARAIAKRFMR